MGAPNGFGVTLQNLFGNWPRENLRYFYNRGEYRDMPKADLDFRFAPVPASHGRRFAIPKILGITPEWRGRYSRHWLGRNLKGFQPDIVFSSVHSMQSIQFADWIARELHTSHALHIMDEPFHGCEHDEVVTLLENTCSLMSISETMRNCYQSRYGMDSTVFHNGAEAAFFQMALKDAECDQPISIHFIGNLHELQHFNAIEDIAEAVTLYNRTSARPALLEIYGNETPTGCSSSI